MKCCNVYQMLVRGTLPVRKFKVYAYCSSGRNYTSPPVGSRVCRRQIVMQSFTSLSEIHLILFPIHFRYSYTVGKLKHIYTELFIPKSAYARYDVPFFVQLMGFAMNSGNGNVRCFPLSGYWCSPPFLFGNRLRVPVPRED